MDWFDQYLDGLADLKNLSCPPDKNTWHLAKLSNQQQRLVQDSMVSDVVRGRLIKEARLKEIEQGLGDGYDSGSFGRASEPTQTTWDVGIQMVAPSQVFGINLSGTSPNITVDWGDGTTEVFTTIGNKTRTYASAGSYTVKISGSFASGGRIRLGTDFTNRPFVKSTSVIPTIAGLTSFANSFNSCTNLTTIPSGLFANNVSVTSFASCFFGCLNLTSIPSGLFANNVSVNSFASCFFGCLNLTSIPSGLFANNVSVTSFASCFNSCTNLTTIPSGLFANNVSVTSFFQCFDSCTNLTTIPSGLFANNVSVTSFEDCFYDVTLTTESYSNLLINMASNAAARLNNVPFGGGDSQYNPDGATARATLATKSWTFSDGGAA